MRQAESSESSVVVRRGAVGDASLLSSLAARLFADTYAAVNDPDDMRLYLENTYTVEKQRAELESADRVVWIAETETGTAIGYAVVVRGTTGDGVVAQRPAEVYRLYADRAWHGRGVGAALMNACLDQARAWSCDTVWLGVWEKNPRAIAFYEKSGFRAVGRQTFLLGRDLQNDLVMARTI